MAVQINGTTGITTPRLDALDLELGSKNVVERGSNANGEYIRFADDAQICTRSIEIASTTPTQIGTSILYSFPIIYGPAYAAPVIALPTVALTGRTSNGSLAWASFGGTPSVGSLAAEARVLTTNPSASAATFYMTAICRWY